MSAATIHGATALALNAIKPVHCPPPAYRPTETVRSTTPCTACSGTINFTVFPSGATTGRCNTAGCIKWSE